MRTIPSDRHGGRYPPDEDTGTLENKLALVTGSSREIGAADGSVARVHYRDHRGGGVTGTMLGRMK